jgi:hypothetical protein
MAIPENGIRDLLVTAGVAKWTGYSANDWRIVIPKFLEQGNAGDRQISIRVYGGEPSNPAWLIDFVTIQCNIRGRPNDYENTQLKARQVKDALLGIPAQELGGDWWAGITQIGDLVAMSYDDKDRPSFILNLRAFIEPATNALTHRESL